MDFNKKVGRSGGVTLPAALRRELGLQPGEKLNVRVDVTGQIVLKRTVGACVFCQADEHLKPYAGRYICDACQEAIKGL